MAPCTPFPHCCHISCTFSPALPTVLLCPLLVAESCSAVSLPCREVVSCASLSHLLSSEPFCTLLCTSWAQVTCSCNSTCCSCNSAEYSVSRGDLMQSNLMHCICLFGFFLSQPIWVILTSEELLKYLCYAFEEMHLTSKNWSRWGLCWLFKLLALPWLPAVRRDEFQRVCNLPESPWQARAGGRFTVLGEH